MMNGQTGYLRSLGIMALALLMLSGLMGCRYLSIPATDDVQAKPKQKGEKEAPVYNSAVIKGKIISTDKIKAATLIAAYRLSAANSEFTEYAAINDTGAFMLYLPEGRYHIYAITDYNHNGIFEDDEVSGAYGSTGAPKTISIREGELITDVAVRTARNNGSTTTFWARLPFKESREIVRQITYNGQALKIYHEYFSLENAQTGYWHPSSFMKGFGAHIYLTEEYNPRKIPLLFVHGTEGSPYNWIYFYMRLDRSRYQPWFFYYPSGIRLPLAAVLLNEELRELQKKYGFQKMGIIAHSVGGLTTRSFLTRFAADQQNNFIKFFVTFATPWSGFGAADASQIITHKSIPVWVDLGTQSPFIHNTMENKLPSNIRHYIFYGKDDKICGSKALDDRAVACSVETFAFSCDHTSILSDRKVFIKFNEILDRELK